MRAALKTRAAQRILLRELNPHNKHIREHNSLLGQEHEEVLGGGGSCSSKMELIGALQ